MRSAGAPATPRTGRDLEDSYLACEALAASHYENFTVGSWLLPRGTRRHIAAMYAFARTTDDLGDEAPGDRLKGLDDWERDLGRDPPEHPLLPAVLDTIRRFDIPREPFRKLIEANRMDQRITRFATWKDLARYCDHSANPCGRLVLHVFGIRDPEAHRLSDATCTALQLTNFWQDIAIDWQKGRVYLPQEDLERFGYAEREIAAKTVNDAFRRLMAFEIDRTRALFSEGLALLDRLRGRARFDIRLFTLGGMRILDLIERAGCDVYRRRPVVSKSGKAWLAVRSLLARRPVPR